MDVKKILFVCTGNTCRSCMAEAIFRYAVENLGDNYRSKRQGEIEVESAGLAVYCSEEASSNAVKVMADRGINLLKHRSRQLTEDMVRHSDLILTMTRAHKEHILNMFPNAEEKVYTLKEFAREDDKKHGSGLSSADYVYDYTLDIRDPYGENLEIYKKCADEINEQIQQVINRIFL